MEQINQDTPLKRQIWIFSFILISIGLILAGLSYYRVEKNRIRQEKYDEIASVAELKVRQIESWRAERLEDLRVLSKTLFTREAILELVKSPASLQLRKEVRERLALEGSLGLYSGAFVLDKTGRTLVYVGASSSVIDTSERDAFHEAVSDRRPILTDLFRGASGMVHIDAMDAILDESGKTAAVVVLRSDADSFLNPLIETWPIPSRSAETLLSEKRGNDIIFLNSLLFNPSAAFSLRIPITSTTTPAVQAVLGTVGMFEGKDYRGKEVLADLRPVPNTPWFMVAKVNSNEILSEANYRGGVVILLVVLFIIISVIATAYAYRHRQAGIYRKMYQSELKRKEVQEEFKTTLYSIGDAVITTDTDGLVKQMNPAAERLTGWTEDDAIGKILEKVFHIVDEDAHSNVESPVQRVLREGAVVGLANHTLLISRDGAEHPIADSGAPILDEPGNVTGVVLIFRDQTQEREAERKVRESEARLIRAELASKFGNWELHLDSQTMIGSPGAQALYGLKEEKFNYSVVKGIPLPEYREKMDNALKNLLERDEPYDIEFRIRAVDTGEIKDIHSIARFDSEKRVVTGVVQDITDRKRAEVARRESQQMLKSVLDTIPARVFWKDRNGIFLGCNLPFAKDSGFSSSGDIVGKDDFQMGWREQAELYRADDRQVIESGIPKIAYEEPQSFESGVRWLRTSKVPLRDAEGEIVGILGTYEDVTEAKQAALLLAHERYLLNALLENTVDSVYFKDTEGRFTRVSAATVAKRGLTSADQLLGKTDFDFYAKERAQEMYEQEQDIIRTNKPVVDVEVQELWTDRPPTWASVTKVPLHDQAGKIIGIFGISRDITQRKRVEEALRKNEKQYRLLAESSPEMIYLVGTDGRLSYVNGRAASELHATTQELVGKHLTEVFPASNAARNLQGLQRVITTKSVIQQELLQEFPSGTKWIDARLSPVLDDDGQVVAVLGLSNDITDRKNAEIALRESEESFRGLFNASPDAIVLIDPHNLWSIVDCNGAACKMNGYIREELIGQSIDVLNTTKETPEGRIVYFNNLRQEGTVHMETLHRHKDGHVFPVEVSTSIFNLGGHEMVLSIDRDITERKRTEEVLRENENRMRTIVEGTPHLFFYTQDTQGRITYTSPSVETITGRSVDEWRSQSHWFITKNKINEYARELTQAHLRGEFTKGPVLVEVEHADQRPILLEVYENPIVTQGKVIGLQGVAHDITERRQTEEALRESEEKYRKFFEDDLSGDYISTPQGKILDCNQAFAMMMGFRSVEAVLNSNAETFYAQSSDRQAFLDRLRREKKLFNCEEILVRQDGQSITVLENVIGRFDSQGELVSLQGYIFDITERKRAEEKVNQLAAIVESSEDAIIGKTLDGIITSWNKGAEKIYGFAESEVIGKSISLLVPPESKDELPGILARLRSGEHIEQYETIRRRKDGREIQMSLTISPIRDVEGKIVAASTIGRNITERKNAEIALRESEEKFRGLVEGSASGILIHDVEHFIYVNASALRMTGYTAEEVYQLAPRDIIHPDFRELIMKRAEDRVNGRKVPDHYEYQILKKSGEARWVDFSTSVIEYQGKPALIASAYDITDRKKLQEQLIQAQKMEGIGKLAGGVAHDYNNMLGVIIGYSDLIMKKVDKSEPLYRYSELIASAAKRAADITRQLLAFARREIVSPRVLDPNKAIESLQKMLQRLIGENIKLGFLPERSVWNIKIDPTQLDQILVNLATNARDAIDDVGTITIETSNVSIDEGYTQNQVDLSPGEYMMISFTDTGKGMSKEVMGRIFEPFFTTKSKGQGTGLGLSTVYGIVKQNGGSINVYSELNIGTTFRIYLPRNQGEVEEPEGAQMENAMSGNETVLVVEDQADLLELAKNSLEEYGYKVLTALSPGEGILLCEGYQGKIHMLLTDVVMPVMNGKELRDKILTIKPDIKTVFMSGYTADVIAIRGVLDEEVDFIQKPFTPYALAKKVRDVLKS